jgi:hypothetical protein
LSLYAKKQLSPLPPLLFFFNPFFAFITIARQTDDSSTGKTDSRKDKYALEFCREHKRNSEFSIIDTKGRTRKVGYAALHTYRVVCRRLPGSGKWEWEWEWEIGRGELAFIDSKQKSE